MKQQWVGASKEVETYQFDIHPPQGFQHFPHKASANSNAKNVPPRLRDHFKGELNLRQLQELFSNERDTTELFKQFGPKQLERFIRENLKRQQQKGEYVGDDYLYGDEDDDDGEEEEDDDDLDEERKSLCLYGDEDVFDERLHGGTCEDEDEGFEDEDYDQEEYGSADLQDEEDVYQVGRGASTTLSSLTAEFSDGSQDTVSE